MLIIGLIIQVSRVLLDSVNAKLLWVHTLGSEVILLEIALYATLLDAILILNPDGLNVSALDNVVPFTVWPANVWLG